MKAVVRDDALTQPPNAMASLSDLGLVWDQAGGANFSSFPDRPSDIWGRPL